jgi:acetolactate synthase I/II/III large subunit
LIDFQRSEELDMTQARTGYELLLDTLTDWHVRLFTGVTGGGIIHLLKHIKPNCALGDDDEDSASFFSIGEYVAGFIPLGYYLASGKIGAAVCTTGAAIKLLTCGLTDAKLHNIPAIYLIPVSPANTRYHAPLQDTGPDGMNVVAQLSAELPSGVFVLDDRSEIEKQLEQARNRLSQSAPVAIVMPPEVLGETIEGSFHEPGKAVCFNPSGNIDSSALDRFCTELSETSGVRRVIVLAGEEAAACPSMPALSTRLCETLQAPIVWSINGANAVERDNPFCFGYLGFGGNDRARQLWDSIDSDDIVITLGFCPDEYTLNFSDIPARSTWNFTNLAAPYGSVDGTFRHRTRGQYCDIRGPIDQVLIKALSRLSNKLPLSSSAATFASNLNTREIPSSRAGTVDIVRLYNALDNLWQPGSMAFDDVCLAYKDRQYVTQRPHPDVRFFSLYRGSAMGGAMGAAIGAKLAKPETTVFVFTGDGCFRLIAGCLAEARNLGLVLFVLDNGSLGIIAQGVPLVVPGLSSSRCHSDLPRIDFVSAARAFGWSSQRLEPDLSNLNEIMQEAYRPDRPSMLIEVPIDVEQVVGRNPRVGNL